MSNITKLGGENMRSKITVTTWTTRFESDYVKPKVHLTNCRIRRRDSDKPWLTITGDVDVKVSGIVDESYSSK
jgi:hypothetical protein